MTIFIVVNLNMNKLKEILKTLGFKDKEITVYLAILKLGEARTADITYHTALPRTTINSILERLTKSNLVSFHRSHGRSYYWVEDPKVLGQKIKSDLEQTELLATELRSYYHTANARPTTEIYDSKVAIQNLIEKTLLNLTKGAEILTWDAPDSKNYHQIFSEDKLQQILKIKLAKGLQTKTLIPANQTIAPTSLKQPIEIRVLPKNLHYGFSVWVLPDRVVIFSGKDPYATVIKHAEIVNSMRQWWRFMWEAGTPLNQAR